METKHTVKILTVLDDPHRISKHFNFLLVSVAEETDFSLALSETPKTGFVALRPNHCKKTDLSSCPSLDMLDKP